MRTGRGQHLVGALDRLPFALEVLLQVNAKAGHEIRIELGPRLVIRAFDIDAAGALRDSQHGIRIEFVLCRHRTDRPPLARLLFAPPPLCVFLPLARLFVPRLFELEATRLFITRVLLLFDPARGTPLLLLVQCASLPRAFGGGAPQRLGGVVPARLAQVAAHVPNVRRRFTATIAPPATRTNAIAAPPIHKPDRPGDDGSGSGVAAAAAGSGTVVAGAAAAGFARLPRPRIEVSCADRHWT